MIGWDTTIMDTDSHSVNWKNRKNDLMQDYNEYKNKIPNGIEKDWSSIVTKSIVIKDKAMIGFGCSIFKGVTIGEGSVVSARAVVMVDVPDWTIVAGNPARVVQRIEKDE
jgi:galactoside O-acetyltransferase